MNYPRAVAIDSIGNLYLADTFNHCIRKITPNGMIFTVAGNGQPGYSGDNGPATSASLNEPWRIAVDRAGNLYIADTRNERVRKVTADGIISTVAGGGTLGDGAPATSAALIFPNGIAFDSFGNLYIADGGRIRRVTADGIIRTVASLSDAASLGVAVDNQGNIYMADSNNPRIVQATANGNASIFAGNGGFRSSGDGGAAVSVALYEPAGVAFDIKGNVYIAESGLHRIRRIEANGIISTVAGTGRVGFAEDGQLATSAPLNNPYSVAVDSVSNLYITDTFNSRIVRVTPNGLISNFAGTGRTLGDGGPATAASLGQPQGLAVDASDNLYIADTLNHRIRKVTINGLITTVAGSSIQGFSGDGEQALNASLNTPRAVALDSAGNIYIADWGNTRIRKVTPDGIISSVVENVFPVGVAVDEGGNVYVSNVGGSVTDRGSRVLLITPQGDVSTVAGNGFYGYSGDGGPATFAELGYPERLAMDRVGNLFIPDFSNNRVRVVLAAKPSYSLDRASLDFAAISGGSRASSQIVHLSAQITGLAFSAIPSVPWISVTPTSGVMAASVQVTADPSLLVPGTYSGSITISAPLADPPTQTVSVSLIVAPANSPRLVVDPNSLSLSFPQQSTPVQKSLFVSNAGSGTLTFRAAPSSDTTWLSVSVASNNASPSAPSSVNVTADPTGLVAGSYSGSVVVTSATTNETIIIPITLTVTAVNRPSILLSQTGISFRAAANSCAGVPNCTEDLPQCFAVLNSGQGTLDFSVTADVPWVQVSRATCPFRAVSGLSTSSPPESVIALRAGSLPPGAYEGRIQVTAPQADNSPQTVRVALTVLAKPSSVGPIIRPTGLVFAAPPGQTPGSLDVYLYNFAQQTFSYACYFGFLEPEIARDWFACSPDHGGVKPSQQSGVVKVYPDFSKLSPGAFHGGMTVQTGYGLQPIEVLAAVSGSGVVGSQSAHAAVAACAPTGLSGIFTLLQPEFNAQLGQPFPMELYVSDDCGAPATAGTVVASFSNGDSGIDLVSLRDGRWAGTWTPHQSAPDDRVQITVHVTTPGTGLATDLQRSGNLQ